MFSEFFPARQKSRGAAARITAVFLFLSFLALPLAMHRGYFDVTETKAAVFAALGVPYLLSQGGVLLMDGERLPGRLRLTRTESLLFLWTGCFLLSSLLGGAPGAALLGRDNRWQGMLMALLYALVFFTVARTAVPSRLPLYGAAGAFFVAALLGVLHHLGINALGLQSNLTAFDRGRFVSTVGNINFFGAYIALLFPVWLALLCRAERRDSRIALGLLSLAGLWSVMVARSESALLGLLAALAALPLLSRGEERALRRSALLLPGAVLGMQLFALLCRAWGARGFSALTALLLRPAPSLTLVLLGLGGYFLLRRGVLRPGTAVRAYGCTLAALLLAALLFLLLANTVKGLRISAALEPYVILDDDWGTDRGRIWRACARLYGSFPWWQKLLGGGSGCLARSPLLRGIFPDAAVDAAHNEYLHILLTSGALGLAAFLGFLGSAAGDARRAGSPPALALLAGLIAYAVQAGVNIAQPMTTPLFLLLLALSAACGRTGAPPPRENGKNRRL